MRLFKLNVRHWGNLHAPVASGWPTSAEGKVLSSFQVFDCKSLWRIEIQSCGLTSNHIQYLLCFSLVCVIVRVCLCVRVRVRVRALPFLSQEPEEDGSEG